MPILDDERSTVMRLNAGPGVEEEQVVDQRAGVLVQDDRGYEMLVGLGGTRHLLALAGHEQQGRWTGTRARDAPIPQSEVLPQASYTYGTMKHLKKGPGLGFAMGPLCACSEKQVKHKGAGPWRCCVRY